jgi:ferrous iron transport protein B
MKTLRTKPEPACRACTACEHARAGLRTGRADFVVALAGNPNVGKSTVFNHLTGLRQHVGNWPGKTVSRMEGAFSYGPSKYVLVDLPGTYSLLSQSADEEVARDFLLFGRPDVTLVVADATALERNLNLVLQVLEITDRVVVALNLTDEARRNGVEVDARALARELGVPVVPMAARRGQGFDRLLQAIDEVAHGRYKLNPRRNGALAPNLERAVATLEADLMRHVPGLQNPRWVAMRLLEGDPSVRNEALAGTLGQLAHGMEVEARPSKNGLAALVARADALANGLGAQAHDDLVAGIYAQAEAIAAVCVKGASRRARLDRTLDSLLTNKWLGAPVMILLFAGVFWLTIAGANVPSAMLGQLLTGTVYGWLHAGAAAIGAPAWLSGFLIDGCYLATAWVVSVMLPPMAIFFPLFTLLEDLGYLPRVAFNLDRLYKAAGAHGKQSLTMLMGFGCNAAGVTSTRIIDSRRERLLAIISNNFSICNGRWPTLILMATIFLGAAVAPAWGSFVAAGAVVGIAGLGILFSLGSSWLLTRTLLKGESSHFTLELPPYRPPSLWQTLYRSIVERTLIVLRRAVVMALPAGAVIWLISNIHAGDLSVAAHLVGWLDPIGVLIGLNGVILLAYLVAIPANEIVIPSVLMLTLNLAKSAMAQQGVMLELDDTTTYAVLTGIGGWTVLTGVNLMLFSLLHNPCSTTILTIRRETGSWKWTGVAVFLPLAIGFGVCLLTATVARMAGWG